MAAPTLSVGTWQGAWSVNLKPSAAAAMSLTALRDEFRTLAHGLGVVWTETGIAVERNPEVSTTPLGEGLARALSTPRTVLTITAWMRTTRFISMRGLNAQLARTLIRHLTGADDATRAARLAAAFDTDGDASGWSEGMLLQEAALAGSGPGGAIVRLAGYETGPAIASCAASFRRYDPASPPGPAGLPGTLARVVASPVDRSTNPDRVHGEEPLFRLPGFNWPVTATELKAAAVVVGGVVVLGVIGYTLRSYAVARIASA